MHIDKDKVEQAIATSTGFREASRKLGFPNRHQAVATLAKQYGVSTDHFTHGHAYEPMIGTKYEMLTVCEIHRRENTEGGRKYAYARCLCECGNYKEVRADGLKSGRYISCGCHSHNRWNTVAGKNHAFTGKGEIRGSYFKDVKRSAQKRNIEFDFTIDEAWKLYEGQNRKCALTGLPIVFGRVYYRHETSASPDRINNNKGYSVANVQWVLKDINMMKGCFDNEYFIKLCNLVANLHPRDVDLPDNE